MAMACQQPKMPKIQPNASTPNCCPPRERTKIKIEQGFLSSSTQGKEIDANYSYMGLLKCNGKPNQRADLKAEASHARLVGRTYIHSSIYTYIQY
jgi:hypothetical protein